MTYEQESVERQTDNQLLTVEKAEFAQKLRVACGLYSACMEDPKTHMSMMLRAAQMLDGTR